MDILKLGNEKDLPENYTGIVEYTIDIASYFIIGKRPSEDGSGDICYYTNGLLHREDGPAWIESNGTIHYYINGKCHREDGPAIIWKDGRFNYFLNGLLHREDGPAIIRTDGIIEYYLNGKLHREDGPAIIYPDGEKVYYLNGKEITTEEVEEWIKDNNIPKVWDNSHKILFKLTFG